jgi:hypothetical protein
MLEVGGSKPSPPTTGLACNGSAIIPMPDGERVRLVHMEMNLPPRQAEPSEIFGIGLCAGVFRSRNGPANMAEALGLGLEFFTAAMRQRIAQAGELGVHAAVGWPASLAWITKGKLEASSLGEPRPHCRW